MKEEVVTKTLLKWLIDNEWEIVCFDFPQSGTGRFLHPDNSNDKNEGSINPDIVAVKNKCCLFFENKDRYYYQDYLKQHELIEDNHYMIDIRKLLSGYSIEKIYYGIGLPSDKYIGKATQNSNLVDFVLGVSEDKQIHILSNSKNINFFGGNV